MVVQKMWVCEMRRDGRGGMTLDSHSSNVFFFLSLVSIRDSDVLDAVAYMLIRRCRAISQSTMQE